MNKNYRVLHSQLWYHDTTAIDGLPDVDKSRPGSLVIPTEIDRIIATRKVGDRIEWLMQAWLDGHTIYAWVPMAMVVRP